MMATAFRASETVRAPRTRSLFAIFAVSTIGLFLVVSGGEGALIALLLYLLSISSCLALLYGRRLRRDVLQRVFPIEGADLAVLCGVLSLQLVALVYFSSFPLHFVQDEFITGYASYELPAFHEIDWFAGYPPEGQFIAQFPILYFALQKPFLVLLGPSLEAIRVSTWPYHLLTVALVYLLGREVFGRRGWAAAAAVIYVLLAPNLYMAGYGTHNISSTCFFLASVYFATLMMRRNSRGYAVACGVTATLGYLTYTASYLTIPLLLLFVALVAAFQWSRRPFELFSIVLVIVVVGLLPFVSHAFSGHNYFLQRSDQVNSISAFWGEDGRGRQSDESAFRLFRDHVRLNIQSLYTPGIGGITDYWFGKQALFDRLTLALLLIGMAVATVGGLTRRRGLALLVVSVPLATFVFGMLLTLPAGGFHRTTLAFPFVALLIALALRFAFDLLRRVTDQRAAHVVSTSLLVGALALANLTSALTMVRAEEEISALLDSVPMTEFIEREIPPGSRIVIAAFGNYHLRQEIYIRTGGAYRVDVRPFEEALEGAGASVIVIWRPSAEQLDTLREARLDGRVLDQVYGVPLEHHRIFVPGAIAGSR
jgi:4-amino-4-deoxy-L-arabinose transferase-like glycosyltransferase